MATLTTLFWDVGGVLLTNGWDIKARHHASERFELDWQDFQRRHEEIVRDFEEGRVSLDTYIDTVVFHQPRTYARNEFREFMLRQSQSLEGLLIVKGLVGKYTLATLNNESRELNLHRIATFDLPKYFSAFFSSSFLGVSKPHAKIYGAALDITQRVPEECLFIDDRAANLDPSQRLGMRTLHYQNATQCRRELARFGV